MKRFSLVILCTLLSAQSIYPMAGINAKSQGWFNNFKNSASGAFSKALSYCSLQKAKEASDFTLDTIKKNKLSAAVFAAAAGTGIGAAYAAHLYQWRERTSTIQWNDSLKYVIAKLDKPYEDDIRAISMKRPVPLYREVPHSVLREYTHESRERNFEPLINYTRMIDAADFTIINPYYEPAVAKHAGIKITRRTPEDESAERALLRYPFTNANAKPIRIDKVFINGISSTVNEMIVYQKAKHLVKPVLYVTLKNKNREYLQLQARKVRFTVDRNMLYVEMNETPFDSLGTSEFDIELHLPQGFKKPEIVYSTQQEKAIKQITY